MLAILAVAIVARALAFTSYGIHHPDEAIQYIEQGHRLAFGSGIVPWEYRVGMRSWLVPLLIAMPMRLGDFIAPGTIAYIAFARLFVAILALAPIGAAYALGARFSRVHGLVAMAVVAVWYESIYFSVHLLTEVLSAACFLPAAALLKPAAGRTRLIAVGMLMAFAVIFRFHYAPAILVFVIMTVRIDWRAWGSLCVGTIVVAVASGAVDIAMGQVPFGWLVENFRQNILHDRASDFGTSGPLAYLQMIWWQWGAFAVPVVILAGVAARRYPALFAAAIVNLAIHMLIGHKEYRFIWFSVQILLILAALGSVDVIARWKPARLARRPGATVAMLIVGWTLASAALVGSAAARAPWRAYASGFELARLAVADRACGVAVMTDNYWATGGEAFLHGSAPLYFIGDPAAPAARSVAPQVLPAANAVVAPPGAAGLSPNYTVVSCRNDGVSRLCLSMRPGKCAPTPQSERWRMQAVMDRNGR